EVHGAGRPRRRHVRAARDLRRELICTGRGDERTAAREIVAERCDMPRARHVHAPEVVEGGLARRIETQVLADVAEIPASLRVGAELIVSYESVRLRVTELDVGVEVDVVATPHLACVVDVEAGRA